jgi:hypothetical protein
MSNLPPSSPRSKTMPPEVVSWLRSPRVHRARASTICKTVRCLASERKGQVNHAGADKITISKTGSARMRGPIAEEGGGSKFMATPAASACGLEGLTKCFWHLPKARHFF